MRGSIALGSFAFDTFDNKVGVEVAKRLEAIPDKLDKGSIFELDFLYWTIHERPDRVSVRLVAVMGWRCGLCTVLRHFTGVQRTRVCAQDHWKLLLADMQAHTLT